MSQISAGDTVTLKSGGPAMTVTKITKDGEVVCVWFPTTTEGPKTHIFLPSSLQPIKLD